MYRNLEAPESAWSKISRSLTLIASVSLLTHTMSITFSIMTLKQQSAGFISIIISSIVCFFLSSSHLTIYGISVLGILYLKMLEPYYTRSELSYIVALSGLIMFPFWKVIHSVGGIFDSFPGRVHASMVFGVALIVLVKFFPLSIENISAFFAAANSTALANPLDIIKLTFQSFNLITLGITVASLLVLFLLRNRLHKIPFVSIFVILGVLINIKHYFKNYQDLCGTEGVDCVFYVIKTENINPPSLEQVIAIIPAALVMTAILIFEQFLYLQEFARRGRCYFGEGDLGEIYTQTRVLALANTLSGCLGGLPICINLFATYESFSFNMKSGYKGTKLVGLMQVPVSYALYSILKWLYDMVPLFVLFVVVALPAIYFLSNMLRIHYRHIVFITVLAALNVLTHPIIALILAAFVSIHDIGSLLKATPAEIIMENIDMDVDGKRTSEIKAQISQKRPQEALPFKSEFVNKVVSIGDDQPEALQGRSYILYRFTGAVSYLNYFDHVEEINSLVDKFVKPRQVPLILSFRYSQIIDQESLEELAIYVQRLREEERVEVIFTGLHQKLIEDMEKIDYFKKMQQSGDDNMYRLENRD